MNNRIKYQKWHIMYKDKQPLETDGEWTQNIYSCMSMHSHMIIRVQYDHWWGLHMIANDRFKVKWIWPIGQKQYSVISCTKSERECKKKNLIYKFVMLYLFKPYHNWLTKGVILEIKRVARTLKVHFLKIVLPNMEMSISIGWRWKVHT